MNMKIRLLTLVLALIMLLGSCAYGGDKSYITSADGITTLTETEPSDTASPDEVETNDGVVVGRPEVGAPGGDGSSSTDAESETDTTEAETTEEETTTEEVTETAPPETSAPEKPVYGFVPYDVPLSIEQQKIVERIAARYNVHEELVFGVMWVESKYNVNAVGKNSKYLGIMQVAVSNLTILKKYCGVTDLMDFEQNVTAGCYYLGTYAERYDHKSNIMLLYYHGGYKYANRLLSEGQYEDSYTRAAIAEMNRIIEARKKLAAEMGITLTGWLYEDMTGKK